MIFQQHDLIKSGHSYRVRLNINHTIEFICQTNIQRFEDNLENISKGRFYLWERFNISLEIRWPTPNYIKKKKIYRQRKARQANAILPQKNRNGPIGKNNFMFYQLRHLLIFKL